MEDWTVFQMDKTASSDKSFLWHQQKRSVYPNMDSNLYVSACLNSQKENEIRAAALHFIADFQLDFVWENAYKWAIYKYKLQFNQSE